MNFEPEVFVREDAQKKIINSILSKIKAIEAGGSELGGRLATISFDELDSFLQPEESNLIEILLGVDPARFGFLGKHLGIVQVPPDLVKVSHQKMVLSDGKEVVLSPQFVPRNVFIGFEKLNHAMERDINHRLLIESAYRSPAYQIITLLHYLATEYQFDLAQTARRVAFPGFSEHGFPPLLALDFVTVKGKGFEGEVLEFDETQEFAWLTNHAQEFGFVLSYPKDNTDGIMYEPWHWRFAE